MRREWIVDVTLMDLERHHGVGVGPEMRRRRRW